MAKKKQEPAKEPVVVEKTLEEMTDAEFLAGIEKWGAPAYNDYMHAPRISETRINGYLSDTEVGILAKNAKVKVEEPESEVKETQNVCVKAKRHTKKRALLLVVIMILTLAFMVGTVLGVLKVAPVFDYFNVYGGENGGTGIIDPVVSMILHLTKGSGDYTFVEYFGKAGEGLSAVPVYSVACAIILYLVCIIVMFVKSVFATFEKRNVCGYYKKRTFGYISIVALLCAVVCVVGGLYVTGGAITDILDFLTPDKLPVGAGYGLYVMLGLPIVTLIMSSFAYGKKK